MKLPGELLRTRLSPEPGWFAIGLSTDQAVKFQGFHARHMLIVFDEASGIPDEIWDAAEGVAVADDNRILAIGNPLRASGRFYQAYRSACQWRRITISALEHPNITRRGRQIPGCVTPAALAARLADWCSDGTSINHQSGFLGSSRVQEPGTTINHHADTFIYKGRTYTPNNLFRARFLGQFPSADDESLIPLRWIEAAMERDLPAVGARRAAADVARYGDDSTVIGLREGPKVTVLDVIHGDDLMEVAGRIAQLAYDRQPESIAVDSIGIGAGVVDRLMEIGIDGVEGVNVSRTANNPERFYNRRAELYWGLRERFRLGDISIPSDLQLVQELAGIHYRITSRGQIQMESKDDMKKRGQASPDRADMLAMLFDNSLDWAASLVARRADYRNSPAQRLREEMQGW